MKGWNRRTAHAVSACALAVVVLSCSTTTGPDLPELTGSWSGSNNQVGLVLTLSEGRFGEISGTGTLNSGSSAFPIVVKGTHRSPALSLQLRLTEEDQILLEGSVVEGSVILGSLDGLGFDRLAITLGRLSAIQDDPLAGQGQ